MRSHPRLSVAILLYAAGLVHWFAFITAGHPTYRAFDWPLIHQWLDVIRQALLSGQVPYHASFFLQELQTQQFVWGDRFFAIPYITVSPQVLLLGLLSVPAFMTFQLLLLYTLGFVGAYQWVKRLDLSLASTTFLLLFFSFNGFLVGRMGVGHLQNAGYFLVPWFLLLLYRCLYDEHETYSQGIVHGLEFAALLVFTLMQGSLHTVYQMVLVGAITVLFYPKRVRWYLGSLIVALIGSTYFIVPNFFYGQYPHAVDRIIFGGYGLASGDAGAPLIASKNLVTMVVNGVYHIWQALTVAYSARFDATWEYSVYVSIIGALVLFGALITVISKKRSLLQNVIHRDRFILAAIVVAGLSFSSVSYHLFNTIRYIIAIPAIDRLPSRLLYYPLSVAFLVASTGFDSFISLVAGKRMKRVLEWIVLSSMFVLLMVHSYGWSVAQTEKNYVRPPEEFRHQFYTAFYNRNDDNSYTRVVRISYGVSLTAILFAGLLYYCCVRRKNFPIDSTATTMERWKWEEDSRVYKISPARLKNIAQEIYSASRLSFHKKLISVYRPYYAPFDRILGFIPKGANVLDIGCGTGTLLLLGQSVIGLGDCYGYDVDTSSIAVANLANRFQNISFVAALTVPLSIVKNVDVILMVDVLHHIPEEERRVFLRYIFTHARKGAHIIVKDLDPKPRWRALANRVTDFISTRSQVSYVSRNDLEHVFYTNGFDVKSSQRLDKHVWNHYLVVGEKCNKTSLWDA